VKYLARHILPHRVILDNHSLLTGLKAEELVEELLNRVPNRESGEALIHEEVR